MTRRFAGALGAACFIAASALAVAAAPASAPVFQSGPLRFHGDGLKLAANGKVQATVTIENLANSQTRVILAATDGEHPEVLLVLAGANGGRCTASATDVTGVHAVEAAGEMRVNDMSPIGGKSSITFKATFNCGTARPTTMGKLTLTGRALTVSEAGALEISLKLEGLSIETV